MCCIGKWEAMPIVEYYSGNDKKINTKGFANITIENVGDNGKAYLFDTKFLLDVGEKECFECAELPMSIDILLTWESLTNALNAKLKVKKYKLVEVCQEPE